MTAQTAPLPTFEGFVAQRANEVAEVKKFNKLSLKKAVDAAGITEYTISGSGGSLEIEVKNDKDQKKFSKEVAKWGGFKTGYGSWILRPGYQSQGNPNDPSSAWHY